MFLPSYTLCKGITQCMVWCHNAGHFPASPAERQLWEVGILVKCREENKRLCALKSTSVFMVCVERICFQLYRAGLTRDRAGSYSDSVALEKHLFPQSNSFLRHFPARFKLQNGFIWPPTLLGMHDLPPALWKNQLTINTCPLSKHVWPAWYTKAERDGYLFIGQDPIAFP